MHTTKAPKHSSEFLNPTFECVNITVETSIKFLHIVKLIGTKMPNNIFIKIIDKNIPFEDEYNNLSVFSIYNFPFLIK